MTAIIKASSRGQIVIPKDIRKELDIFPGKKLSIKEVSGCIVIIPLPNDPVASFCGIFEEGPSLTKALIDERKKDKALETAKTS